MRKNWKAKNHFSCDRPWTTEQSIAFSIISEPAAVLEVDYVHSSLEYIGNVWTYFTALRGASVKQHGVKMKLCLAEGILPPQPILEESVGIHQQLNPSGDAEVW